jgi:hypothetical protein
MKIPKKLNNPDTIVLIILIFIFFSFAIQIFNVVKMFRIGEPVTRLVNMSAARRAYIESCTKQFQNKINQMQQDIYTFSQKIYMRMDKFMNSMKTPRPLEKSN